MPLYEYTCDECGRRFDALRSFKDADMPISCENCGSNRTRRCITVFFTQSGGKVVAGGSPGCAGCAGGSCATCGN
jgi:putative FmdB family regulatory protein